MAQRILYAVFALCIIAEVRSDTIYSLSGYAFPNGISTTDPASMVTGLQQTLNGMYNLVPASARPPAYEQAKAMFDVAATRAAQVNGALPAAVPAAAKLPTIPEAALPAGVNLPATPWTNGLPPGVRQLLEAVQLLRSVCPLCQAIDRALQTGGIPRDNYAIDGAGTIYRDRGQKLLPSNYGFNGGRLVDASGVTIISIY